MAGLSKGSRNLILAMVLVVAAGILIARSYYGKQNRSVDPRIQPARVLYGTYDQVAGSGDYHRVFALMDSIESIYLETPFYSTSFELGVLENNRAAALLTIALFGDSIPRPLNPCAGLGKDSILSLAEERVRSAMGIYEAWDSVFGGMTEGQIRDHISEPFAYGLQSYDAKQVEEFLQNRVKEIVLACKENKRRLSVCHTNLGVIHRIREDYTEAVREYELALELWDRNLEAENNLNRLLSRPLKKRNFIQKMFPPDRGK